MRTFPLLLIPAALLPTPATLAQSPHHLLAASTISYAYDTPPRPTGGFHYLIRIKPNRSATIYYFPGPGNSAHFDPASPIGPLNPTPPSTRTFQLTPATYRTLLDTLLSQGILATGWPTHQPHSIGGPYQRVSIQESPTKIIAISPPALTSLADTTPASRFVKITEAIRAVIPDATWTAIGVEQDAYEKSHNP